MKNENFENLKKYSVMVIDIDTIDNVRTSVTEYSDRDEFILSGARLITYEYAAKRFADLLEKNNIKGTFFFRGIDLNNSMVKKLVSSLHKNGHEIGNHTTNHYKDLIKLEYKKKFNEIFETHKKIADITGESPIGYKAPAYLMDLDTYNLLYELGYKYSASIQTGLFFIYLQFVVNILYKRNNRFQDMKTLFKAPRKPYNPYSIIYNMDNKKIIEFPVNVIPLISFPYTLSIIPSSVFFMKIMTKLTQLFNQLNIIEFHDFEFGTMEEYRDLPKQIVTLQKNYFKKNLKKRLDNYQHLIDFVKGQNRIITNFKSIVEKKNDSTELLGR